MLASFRFILAAVVAWLIFTLGGIIWHEVIFEDWYNEWVFGIERMEMPILYFVITHAMRALVFVYVYHMLYKGGNPLMKGLKFGFLMGILTGLTVTSYYGDFAITSPGWAVLEFVYNIVRAILICVTIAAIIGERKVEPVR
ncbi:MAG: hypothetical protein JKX84_02320 [Flavobacteriales bacterium]|nr:hypothetical protein [Flavobacteriales bacterium]